MTNIQSNASAGATINSGQQTFYMADRLKKTGGTNPYIKHIRHGSVDENNQGILIQSTNDSRVEEMLPSMQSGTVSQQHRQNTKSVQMRSTMYNNSYFQKLLNNVQNVSQKVSVVDQKGGKKSSSNNLDNSSNL